MFIYCAYILCYIWELDNTWTQNNKSFNILRNKVFKIKEKYNKNSTYFVPLKFSEADELKSLKFSEAENLWNRNIVIGIA